MLSRGKRMKIVQRESTGASSRLRFTRSELGTGTGGDAIVCRCCGGNSRVTGEKVWSRERGGLEDWTRPTAEDPSSGPDGKGDVATH